MLPSFSCPGHLSKCENALHETMGLEDNVIEHRQSRTTEILAQPLVHFVGLISHTKSEHKSWALSTEAQLLANSSISTV